MAPPPAMTPKEPRFPSPGANQVRAVFRRRVIVGDKPAALTAVEDKFLPALALDAGRVMTCDTLVHRVRNGRSVANANLVRNLRQLLGDGASGPTWIFRLRGVGYRMAEPGKGR